MENGFQSHSWLPSPIKKRSLTLLTWFGAFVSTTFPWMPSQRLLPCLSRVVMTQLTWILVDPNGSGSWMPSRAIVRSKWPSRPAKKWRLLAPIIQSTRITWCLLVLSMALSHFFIFIHDMDSTWKGLTKTRDVVIDAKTGIRIIVDGIFSWAPTFEDFIKYLTCQLQVFLSQNPPLSLKKCLFS